LINTGLLGNSLLYLESGFELLSINSLNFLEFNLDVIKNSVWYVAFDFDMTAS